MKPESVLIGAHKFGNHLPFVLIGGPCVIESESLVLKVAHHLKEVTRRQGVPYIFKSSYDKANRSSIRSFRGPGLKSGLKILAKVKQKLGLPILTDVHSPQEAWEAGKIVDILQIPAFLCRQTDLLLAAGKTKKGVNIKKGQFMSPWEMKNVLEKVISVGNKKVFLTERGSTFGYNNLVVDMRGLEIMKSFGFPVIYDATHSVQLPGGRVEASGGQREFVWPLARAAVAIGVAGLFMEIHPNPDQALSDGPNSVFLRDMEKYLRVLVQMDRISKEAYDG